MKNKIKQSLATGSRFIAKQNLTSQSSPSEITWQSDYHYRTTFVPSLILQCLADIDESKLNDYKISVTSFLNSQASDNLSFNYWDRTSPEAEHLPYPDDLDDTFCALIALQKHRPITGNQLAKAVQLLVANEVKPGGPYRTWLTTDHTPVWQDVDIAVNANIAYFLDLVGSPLPSLTDFLNDKILADKLDSPYYPSRLAIYYYLARVCPSSARNSLTGKILTQKTNNSLEAALKLNALCKLGIQHPQMSQLAKQLLDNQGIDGSWPAAAFCLDPMRDSQSYYHGSASLTTAFAVEALNSYQKHKRTDKLPSAPTKANQLHDDITRQVQSSIAELPPDMQKPARLLLDMLNKPEITLLPYFFYQSLIKPPKMPVNGLRQLGLANLYGWIAYTIYDDFLDDEGIPCQLPVANWALRNSLLEFQTIQSPQLQTLVLETFNTIDGANAWEVTNCRWIMKNGSIRPGKLPDYQQRQKLAERSIGHYLGPMAILSSSLSLQDNEVIKIQRAFRQYLIARQLNDDAHDWQEDFERGQISFVVGHILHKLGYPDKPLTQTLISQMRQEFWSHSLPEICAITQRHINRGRRELNSSSILVKTNFMHQLFADLEKSVKATLSEQERTVDFLDEYKKVPLNY